MKKFFYILLIIIFLSLTVSCQRRQDRSISPSPSTSSTPSSGLPPLSRLQTAPEVPLEIRPNLLKRKLTLEEYPGWLREYLQSRVWRKIDFKPQLSRSLLEESLNLGTQYLVRNQKPEGNFRYEYHFISNKLNDEENQVRQAGVVWGLP